MSEQPPNQPRADGSDGSDRPSRSDELGMERPRHLRPSGGLPEAAKLPDGHMRTGVFQFVQCAVIFTLLGDRTVAAAAKPNVLFICVDNLKPLLGWNVKYRLADSFPGDVSSGIVEDQSALAAIHPGSGSHRLRFFKSETVLGRQGMDLRWVKRDKHSEFSL